MPKINVVDNAFITLTYDSDTKIVSHQIRQYTCGQPLRDALVAGTEQLKKNGAHKWLSDDRNSGALPKEDLEWTKNVWTKATIAAGWKFWALVLPASLIGQQNMKRFCEEFAKAGVTVQTFSDPALALAWLKTAK
jgi:hypothetical protein